MSNQLQVSGEAKIRSIQGPVVANSGVITALNGDATQYVRGDGTLADFPTSTGGGSSVSYYLNTSVSQGTIGGVAYKQLSKTPISGAGTDVSTSVDGYIASYITDANDPALLEVPAGNFNCEFYFSVNSNAHNPYVYAELYKYDGTTFTLLGSSQSVPEYLTNGTTLSPYYFAIPVATSVLTITDRIAIRIYVNVDGRTVTLHTENNHLCQVVTTFSKGLISLNNLTRQNQFFATGTSGTDFNISSTTATHTFNLPVASAANTGKLSSTDWSTFNGKVPYTGATANVDLGLNSLFAYDLYANGNGTNNANLYLKQGTASLLIQNGYSNILATGTKIGFQVATSAIAAYYADLQFSSLTAQRTYTLPDASGTLALTSDLSSYVPYTGATGSVNLGIYDIKTAGIQLKDGQSFTPTLGYTSLSSVSSGVLGILGLTFDNNAGGATLQFTRSVFNTYNFPNASGTLALLQADQIFTGINSFDYAINYKTGASLANVSGYISQAYAKSGTGAGSTLSLKISDGNSVKAINLDFVGSPATYTYTFPSSTGTVALLESTQTFSGTNTFSGLSSFTFSSGTRMDYGPYLTKGSIPSAFSGSTTNIYSDATTNNIVIRDNSSIAKLEFNNSTQTYTFPAATGTLALGTGTTNYHAKWTGTNTIGNSLIWDNGTNVGIGNTNTSYTLDVSGTLRNTTSAYFATASGNVGIGTTTATNKLTITNDGNAVNALRINDTNANASFLSLSASNTDAAIIANGTAAIPLDIYTGGSARVRVTGAGNVLIGTTATETASLTVVAPNTGTAAIQGRAPNGTSAALIQSSSVTTGSTSWYAYVAQSGNGSTVTVNTMFVYGNGNLVNINGSYGTLSDIKLKENIIDATPKLNDILKLKVRNFNLIADDNKTKQIGFIAQEMEKIFPALIEETPDKDLDNNDLGTVTKTIKTSVLVPMLVKAIQEQQIQIQNLQEQINILAK